MYKIDKKSILDWQDVIKEVSLFERNIYFNYEILKINKIISFVWARRSGKTFFMYQILKNLIKKWELKYEQIVFIDFSEILEKNIDFSDLLTIYYSLYADLTPFFVFDEIQEINNFREWIIYLFNKWYKIFLSGSNSKLLSTELSTNFRWRVYENIIYPLSFFEFCEINKFEIKNDYSSKKAWQLNNIFLNYLEYWAFPEMRCWAIVKGCRLGPPTQYWPGKISRIEGEIEKVISTDSSKLASYLMLQ